MKKITLTAIVSLLLISCSVSRQYPKKYGKDCMSRHFIGYGNYKKN